MPAWILPSPKGTVLEERNVRTVFARVLAKADKRQTPAQPEVVPTTNRPSVSRLF
jgi:hypothetical protein